jgi:hypothetical protein
MSKWWMVAVAAALGAAPAAAQQDGSLSVSVGYAFSQYLEEDGGSAPLGAYVSIATPGKFAWDLDVAWHRDSEDVGDISGDPLTLNTFIGGLGGRFTFGEGTARPFLHVLGGLRYDKVAVGDEGVSNTSWGGMTGLGVDIGRGKVALRLGADFQAFFESGENFKTLRLTAGVTF